jgi:hypothetical protein
MELPVMDEDYNKLIKERISTESVNKNKRELDKNRILLEEMQRTRKISKKLKQKIVNEIN